MSSHFCLSCYFPVYPVNSNRGREVYVCLTEDCRNFKVSVPKFETVVELRQEMIYEPNYAAEPPDYPAGPLEDESPVVAESQLGVARPHTEQPTHGDSDYPDYLPEAESLFSPGENQAFVAQRCLQQSGREEPVVVPQSSATSGAKDARSRKTRRQKNAPVEERNQNLEKPWSELPIEDGSDPMAEITRYVYRPLKRRRLESVVNGKARRELNPFILYRKAYKDVVKMAGMEAFGTMAAKSWARESASVRAQFSALANTEKRLHKEAFPDYKYVPKRISKKKGKK